MTDTTQPTQTKNRLAELLQKHKLSQPVIPTVSTDVSNIPNISVQSENKEPVKQFSGNISYNKEQLEFINQTGSCVLIGAAGTGKTTCTKGKVNHLIESKSAGVIQDFGHKFLPSGTPGIVAVSFTRRAVNNLKRALPESIKSNCITIHKLLEYEPVYYEVIDEVTGQEKKTMKFEPTRHSGRVLDSSIKYVIIDESSMVSVELYKQLEAAMPHKPVYIFLGDIQQLPPVFGSAILGYKMLELPTIELTQVYRQALNSPIISLATDIRNGVTNQYPTTQPNYKTETEDGTLTIHPWKKKIHADVATLTFSKFITQALETGDYNPEEDMILIPFNKACGTDEVNKHIANYIAKKQGKSVYEVIAGFNKHYFSVGDKVLYDKDDAIISRIEKNPDYLGAPPQPASHTLDYWGHNSEIKAATSDSGEVEDVDFLLSQMASSGDDSEERVRRASHKITVTMVDTGKEIEVDAAADINSMLLSYTLTVHKSQGSEWRKVFILFHQSHATMLQRELLYTAVTRAREELYIICEPETFERGVKSQKIKGTTLAEKAEYFKGKLERGDY